MKKSEIYHLAQVAVLNTATIAPENKLEILHELMDAESLAQFTEEMAAEEGNNAETV